MRKLLPILVLLAAASAAPAQVTTASLAGVVLDETGAALPGATVTIKHVETGRARPVIADGEGRYRAPELDPGTYDVMGELTGFQTSVRSGLLLTLGQNAVVNMTLKLGTLAEQVLVTESAPLVEITRGALAGLVDERQIRDLPLNGRDFTQLTLGQPGVISVPTAGRTISRGMGTQISVAGARPNQISYLLDGTDIDDQGGQSPGSAAGGMLGVDTIREFQVLTNNYSAEYGRSAGGVISAITRSGSNRYSGSMFEFFRDDALDAKNFFDPLDQPIPPFTRNQFGANLGGPIARDHTFFFGAYEGLRQRKGLTIVDFVPSRATRARADINPIVRPYLDIYPLPNGPETGPSGVYTTSINEPTDEHYFLTKVDHSFSNSDSGSVRYTFDQATVVTPQPIPLFADSLRSRNQYVMLEEKHIFTSRLMNVVRFAYNRSYQERVNVDNVTVDPSLLFVPGGGQFGNITVSGLTSLGTDNQTPTRVALNTFQLMNDWIWSAGAHSLKLGGAITRYYNNNISPFVLFGSYTFTSIDDFLAARPNTYEGGVPGLSQDRYMRQNLIAFFAQDDVTLGSRVTLNAGVRYEFFTTPKEKYDRVANLRNDLDRATTVGYPFIENPSLKNVAPRVGFAWNITGDGKTALRGGGGMFYEPLVNSVYRTLANATPPFFYSANLSRPPFPRALDQTLTPILRLDLLDFHIKNPYMAQYNLTLQREVLPRFVVTAGYVGSRGIHLIRNVEANQAVATIVGGRYFFPAGTPRRNPAFQSIRIRRSDGNSWYNGLILGATKRFGAGLQLQASYTYGKSIDEGSISVGSNDLDNGFQPRYADDRRDNRGPSDFDIRHNFSFTYTYEIPSGDTSGGRALLLKGWQLSGIVSLHSGVPFTPVLAFDRARALPRSGGAGQRPDPAPGFTGPIILGGPAKYFDPNAFVLPEAGFFGALGRNTLYGPGFATWDGALFKNFAIAGSRKLQFRGEVFNLLNRANFALPETAVFNSAGRVATAGQITRTVSSSRQVQLGVKMEF